MPSGRRQPVQRQWSIEIDFRKDEMTNAWLQAASLPGRQSTEHGDRTCLRISVRATDVNGAATKAYRVIADAAAHSSAPSIITMRIRPAGEANYLPELVGLSEISTILGVSRQRAAQVARKAGFPYPVAELAMGPVYVRHDVEDYARDHGRIVHHLTPRRAM
ncbi:hypothetical protein GCM10010166_64700 [Couchioplanes caeruleus subsp. azureus]|nr:hypothetical protein GCM10010166_64700 [Couchioplanes caeruleus subsp. azureus]